jgi:hypothetical protein
MVLAVSLRHRLQRLGVRASGILPERLRPRLHAAVASLIEGLGFLRSPGRAAAVATLTALAWGGVLLSVYIALRAMHIGVPVTASGLVLAATGVGMAVPAVPGGIGTFEYAVIFALGHTGVEQSRAAAYAVVLHVSQLVPITLIGLVCAWRARWTARREAHASDAAEGPEGAGPFHPGQGCA